MLPPSDILNPIPFILFPRIYSDLTPLIPLSLIRRGGKVLRRGD